MWGFDSFIYVYLAIGCGVALISLFANWSESRKLSPLLFIIAHALWPLSLGAILVAALVQSLRSRGSDRIG